MFLNVFISFCKNWQKQVNIPKLTNNLMSIFGLIEENIELSHIHLAVKAFQLDLFLTKVEIVVLLQ